VVEEQNLGIIVSQECIMFVVAFVILLLICIVPKVELFYLGTKEEGKMKRKKIKKVDSRLQKFLAIVSSLSNKSGYLMCVATKDNDNIIESKYLTMNFPKQDILNTINEFKKLAYKDVEGFYSEKN